MSSANLLFNSKGKAITPDEIRKKISDFGYKEATQEIIEISKSLGKDGEVFVKCTARILSNFGMTRAGVFKGVSIASDGSVNGREILDKCWDVIGNDLIIIRKSIPKSGNSRDRYLLKLNDINRERLITQIWDITKQLLPITMGKTSYGLVGASKILFAVLPEIVLPVDNQQWLSLFKTVDIGDVIRQMVVDIQQWENATQSKLNEMDKNLTTLPSVYNVITMDARQKKN
jgi:hypothetical protein